MRIKKRYRVFFLLILLSLAFAITLGWAPYNPLAGIEAVAAAYGEKNNRLSERQHRTAPQSCAALGTA
jgi:hypothetical protein